MKSQISLFFSLVLVLVCSIPSQADAQTDVVAFWGFTEEYNFNDPVDPALPDGPNRFDFNQAAFPTIIDNTVGASANLQAYLGNAAELDDNGGGGFVPYTSPVSGDVFGASRTLKFDDLRGGGDDFSIGTEVMFELDRLDGAGPAPFSFRNDALVYLTLDGTGFQDFQLRFDVEATPGLDPLDPTATDLPESFDVFYRTTGTGGTWFRGQNLNNIALTFSDFDPANPDPNNQIADSGFVSLDAALNNASQIEIIISDFVEGGNANNELELDNFEIVANAATMTVHGDVDLNGVVNFSDISPFIAVLASGEFQAEADCDGNGIVNFADISPFIAALASQ